MIQAYFYFPRLILRLTKLIIAGLCLLPFTSSALELNELILQRSGDYLVGKIIVDGIEKNERKLEVFLPPADAYRALGLDYNNFIRDLKISYANINRRTGRISINFPYEPVDAFDLLLEVNWGTGELQRRYSVSLNGLLPRVEGSVVARISPSIVEGGKVGPPDQATKIDLHEAANEIKTIEGDSWHNLALAIRQAYLRDDSISQEQVMLALRNKNSEDFATGTRLRIGVALSLPDYYEVSSIDSDEAQRTIYNIFRRAQQPRARLEIAVTQDNKAAPSVATLAQADAPQQPVGSNDADANQLANAEELDKDKREAADTNQRLNLVKRQLEQIDKLIKLKTTRLFVLQKEANNNENVDLSSLLENDDTTGVDFTLLLQERIATLQQEFVARPRFWLAILVAIIVLFTILSWLVFKLRSLSSSRTRATIVRNLRRDGLSTGSNTPVASSNRSLMFDEEEGFSPPTQDGRDNTKATSTRPPPGTNKQDFIQDDLTNANLDLARAYINMGENKRARTMLEDVLNSGSPAEQSKARQLLNQVD